MARHNKKRKWSECTRKKPYETKEQAERVRDHREKENQDFGLNVYRCHHGEHWHLGHRKGVFNPK